MTIIYRLADIETELEVCQAIRHEVFVIGQNVPLDEEFDGKDAEARHYIAADAVQPVGTARVRILEGAVAKIERVAVLEKCQGLGVGKALMEFILHDLEEEGRATLAKLGAQTHALAFYEKLGFTKIGEEYLDANIPHYDMVRDL